MSTLVLLDVAAGVQHATCYTWSRGDAGDKSGLRQIWTRHSAGPKHFMATYQVATGMQVEVSEA